MFSQPVRTTITSDGSNVTITTPVNSRVIPVCDFHWTFVDGNLQMWIEGRNELIPGGRLGNFTISGATTQAAKLSALGAITSQCSGGGLDSLYYGVSLIQNGDTIPAASGSGLSVVDNPDGGQNLYQINGTTTSNEYKDYIDNVRIPVAQNWKFVDTVSVPGGFTLTPAFSIFRREDGTFGTSIDDWKSWRIAYKPTGKAYYVDPLTGSDSNDGLTPATAFATFNFARTRTDVNLIYLKGCVYPDITSWSTGRDTVAVIGYGGTPVVGSFKTYSWTATTLTGVYKATTTDSTKVVLDVTQKDNLGEYLRMTKKADADTLAVASQPGSFCFNGTTTIYVHAADRAVPSVYENVMLVDRSPFSIARNYTYLENIDVYAGSGYTMDAGKIAYIRDVGFFHSHSSGDLINISDTATITMYNCRFGHSNSDIVDYDTGAKGFEINCLGRYAGYLFAGADNQVSTAHGGARVVTINADYSGSSNETILDVNSNTKRWILGGKFGFGGDWNKETGFSTYTLGVGNASGNYALMWIDSARLGGNSAYDLRAAYGTIYLRNVKLNSTIRTSLTFGGAIQKY